ncbi:hypothetical protein [Emticicia sp. C21]|uniref:hypothetical protein n=1 Tax=Emticicia sp. C21 TaxID=2302915 RepID=UPI000E354194|nr:hypothetical protein [Emticicia sp. C21]RFS18069.1 hypothetical protein D0T08_02135 [Emticicia sp. C21]
MGANLHVEVHLKLADNTEENFDIDSENIYYLFNGGTTHRHYNKGIHIYWPYTLTKQEINTIKVLELTEDDYEDYKGIPDRFSDRWASPEEYEAILYKVRLTLYSEVKKYKEESRENYSKIPPELQKAAHEYYLSLNRLFYELAAVEHYVNMAKEKQAKIILTIEES